MMRTWLVSVDPRVSYGNLQLFGQISNVLSKECKVVVWVLSNAGCRPKSAIHVLSRH